MPSTILLSPDNSPLRTLTLSRLQLDQDAPVCTLETTGEELLVYPLIGKVEIREYSYGDMWAWGTLGARRKITDPDVAAMRFPLGQARVIEIMLADFSADLLLATVPGISDTIPPLPQIASAWAHQVGEGTHQREVREVPTPPGYAISCGETLQQPGMISSWPPHANNEDLAKFQAGVTTWEEAFFVVAPSPGFVALDGYYADKTRERDILRLENGRGYAMPLGSHVCYAAPDSYLYYAWFYCGDALQKQYRKYADDVGVYRK